MATAGVVVDFFSAHDQAFYDCLAANGITGIARYLTPTPNDVRTLTAVEVAQAHQAGLAVHCVFEGNPTTAGYFTFAQGAADCQRAQAQLKDLGAPDGMVTYFAVDAPPSVIPVTVLDAYFNGVEWVQTPAITPGIYGFSAHVEYARTRFPNIGQHLWQTYGTPSVPLDLWQHEQRVECGVEVDVNTATVDGWREDVYDFETDPKAVAYREDVKNTFDAIKGVLATLAHHPHLVPAGKTSEPLIPPVPGAAYFSSNDDLTVIGWSYPDKTIHFFQLGVEIPKP